MNPIDEHFKEAKKRKVTFTIAIYPDDLEELNAKAKGAGVTRTDYCLKAIKELNRKMEKWLEKQ